ncbi:MAG: hypothetical protein F2839_02640 [Actinobacteria bacterium]|uniref:Unannotated protein n=1 Tax=freshwater metagenome TaxID=449393 RepID=A0A6J5Z3S0_9ZZZZ|nr:hypothetical protein [Actinomycetota bacterium]
MFDMSYLVDVFTHWSLMSILMMSPISLVISWKQRHSVQSSLSSLAGYSAVWIFAGVPICISITLLSNLNHVHVTFVLWVIAAVYQFSKIHVHALSDCMNVSGKVGFRHGLRVGLTCVKACGPLMMAAFWSMPSSVWPMVGLCILMVMEFVSVRQVTISRVMGLASGVFAIGFLFLSPITEFGTAVVTHNHF